MAVIKNLAFCRKTKIKNIASFYELDDLKSGFTPFPLDIIHYFLPLKFKFLTESFAIFDRKNIKGIISLKNEEYNPGRFKINKFFLGENCFAKGEQLINFAISKYCALGATSFQVTFPQELENMLELFVNVCKFRIASYEFIYKTSSKDFQASNEATEHFRAFKGTHSRQASELHNSSLNSHQKHTFVKSPKQFRENLFIPFNKAVVFKYVLEDDIKNTLYAYFTISTVDNKNYLLDVTLNPAFNDYFMDVISFCAKEISRRSSDWNLYIKLNSCYSNCQNLQDVLELHKFEFCRKNFVLTKDFLKPIKQEGVILNNARVIFNNTAAGF